MKMQSFKLTMAAILVSLSAALLPTNAAASPNEVIVEIPFEFQVGNQHFPAGNYRFKQVQDNVIYLKSANSGAGGYAFAVSNTVPFGFGKNAVLTFHKYGEKRYLRAVKFPATVLEILKTRSEKKLQQKVKTEKLYVD